MATTRFRTADVDGSRVFYREAGKCETPVLLLLHGFPTSSHMFRDLIPQFADSYHIVAPDLPGFGRSDIPLAVTFAKIADVIGRFTEVVRHRSDAYFPGRLFA
ncbi:MAG TPA: alpha/beta fold hydrolase [Nitrospira sp.]|nr:alpha/beta fold hydrolase [Nitrospira sp.]